MSSASSNMRPEMSGTWRVERIWGLTRVRTACGSESVGLLWSSNLALNPPKPGNQVVETLAEEIPGVCSMDLRMVSWAWMRSDQVAWDPLGKATPMTNT